MGVACSFSSASAQASSYQDSTYSDDKIPSSNNDCIERLYGLTQANELEILRRLEVKVNHNKSNQMLHYGGEENPQKIGRQ